jgi:hypothetical protein
MVMLLTGSDLEAMKTSLEPAGATAPANPTAAASGGPVAVYLARLTSADSRRAMASSLELLAELLVDGQPADRAVRARRRQASTPLAIAVPWHELRYGHTQALRSWLAEHCSPAAANRHLAALRGVLREAWRLGLMGGEDLARAIDLASVPGTSLPAGRYVETVRSGGWSPLASPITLLVVGEMPLCWRPSSWVACAGPRQSPSTSSSTTPRLVT